MFTVEINETFRKIWQKFFSFERKEETRKKTMMMKRMKKKMKKTRAIQLYKKVKCIEHDYTFICMQEDKKQNTEKNREKKKIEMEKLSFTKSHGQNKCYSLEI